ncbi:hypothetical protein EJB05_15799, partial [Eragrostis curvula]
MEGHHYYHYLGLALVSLFLVLAKRRRHGLRLAPGPWQLPIVGSLHHMVGQHPHRALRDLARRHGSVMLLRLGEVPTLVLSSREAAHEVMKTHDMLFASRPMSPTNRAMTHGGRDIMFMPYGEHLRQIRKILVTELLSMRRVLSFRGIREEAVAAMLREVAADAAASSRPIEMRARLCELLSDLTVCAVIGGRWKERDLFLQQIDTLNKITAGYNLVDLWPSSRLARRLSSAVRRTEESRDVIFRILDGIINEHLERMDSGGTTGGEAEDILDVLLKIQRDGEIPLDTDIIKGIIFELFGAGSETTGTVLEWAMAELIRNPRVMQRATAEVRSVFNGHSTVPEQALGELRYLHLVVRETFRLHPPAPFLPRQQATKPCSVLGYDLPPGTTVLVNIWALGRDERYWPGDPEAFRPERFEDGEVDFKGANFEFLPFGAGRRMCPGMAFGLAKFELTLANLLFHFDWEAPGLADPADFDMSEVFGVSVRRKAGLLLHPILRIPVPGL